VGRGIGGRLSVCESALRGGVFLLPLVCWPNLQHPFSTPKTWLLGLLGGAALLARDSGEGRPRQDTWPWLAWLAAVALAALAAPYASAEALLLAVLPLPLGWALWRGGMDGDRLRRALVWGAAVESAIACLQFAGIDPLQSLGWRPETFASERMRVYGTMGNPDFVAAWLCATLPLYAGARFSRARWMWAGLGLQSAAIFATGSRVLLLALPAAAAVMAVRSRRLGRWWVIGAPLAIALVLASPARPLRETAAGRLYLTGIAASHWREVPVFGFGPGAYRLKFPQWQTEWLRGHGGDAAYAGLADHAHNDFVEFWVEYGPVGLAAFLCAGAWLMARAWTGGGGMPGVWGGMAALLAIALVDFPFHRPAEWGLYWLYLGLLRRKYECPTK